MVLSRHGAQSGRLS